MYYCNTKFVFLLLIFSQNKRFLIDYFTGSKFRININSNLVVLIMSQLQNYNFGSCVSQIFQCFAGVPQNEDSLYSTLLTAATES